jgi:hypothetical protein
MASRQAFSRSRVVLARYDVSPHLVKWWAKVKPDDGQVSEKERREKRVLLISLLLATMHLLIFCSHTFFSFVPSSMQVTRHISPFEQHAIMPWFSSWPKKVR